MLKRSSALTQLDIKSTSWEKLDESERRRHLGASPTSRNGPPLN